MVIQACRWTHPIRGIRAVAALPFWGCLIAAGCVGPRPGTPHERHGDEIVACGRFFHTGAPVVLWLDPCGYDAYRVECRFTPDRALPADAVHADSPARYGSFRRHMPPDDTAAVRENGWELEMLRKHVDLFVLHYDACGTSRRCFKVLHDVRGLSVHFLLDVDGTIYQTLDLKERAWHAGPANDRSIGIEIANMGAYEDRAKLDAWYSRNAQGRVFFEPPLTDGRTGIRTPEFVAYPAQNEAVRGRIHNRDLWQYDLTDAQYDSLTKLVAALTRVLPRIRPDAPRRPTGEIRADALTPDELARFSGIVGHYHITESKVDPGPAFDWARVLPGSR